MIYVNSSSAHALRLISQTDRGFDGVLYNLWPLPSLKLWPHGWIIEPMADSRKNFCVYIYVLRSVYISFMLLVLVFLQEINDFRGKCGSLFLHDWITVPLVYTQVNSVLWLELNHWVRERVSGVLYRTLIHTQSAVSGTSLFWLLVCNVCIKLMCPAMLFHVLHLCCCVYSIPCHFCRSSRWPSTHSFCLVSWVGSFWPVIRAICSFHCLRFFSSSSTWDGWRYNDIHLYTVQFLRLPALILCTGAFLYYSFELLLS